MKNTQSTHQFRTEKVASRIQQDMGTIIKPYLEGQKGLVTVSRVEVSSDMKWCKVWISILGGNDESVLKALKGNIYDIQGELNRKFTTKIVPRIQFELDTNPRYAAHIEEVIKEIHKEND